MSSTSSDFRIAGTEIPAGTRKSLELTLGRLHTSGRVDMPVHVVNGRRSGPVLFVAAAIHGDEINGTEIIRRLLRHRALSRLRGVLLCVPVVNVYGFITQSRYLPDRRDLNRSFPGSSRGSMASRIAHLFTTEVASQSTHGIDLHTGAVHRANFPQVRCDTDHQPSFELAQAFGAPLIVRSGLLEGSLRAAGRPLGVPVITYEGGEALRFDESAIRVGLRGVLQVMRALGMLTAARSLSQASRVTRHSRWIRAPEGGVHRARVRLGSVVREGEILGWVADPLGEDEFEVRASRDGIVIGLSNLPLVNEGDALFNVAHFDDDPSGVSADFEDLLPSDEVDLLDAPRMSPG